MSADRPMYFLEVMLDWLRTPTPARRMPVTESYVYAVRSEMFRSCQWRSVDVLRHLLRLEIGDPDMQMLEEPLCFATLKEPLQGV